MHCFCVKKKLKVGEKISLKFIFTVFFFCLNVYFHKRLSSVNHLDLTNKGHSYFTQREVNKYREVTHVSSVFLQEEYNYKTTL